MLNGYTIDGSSLPNDERMALFQAIDKLAFMPIGNPPPTFTVPRSLSCLKITSPWMIWYLRCRYQLVAQFTLTHHRPDLF